MSLTHQTAKEIEDILKKAEENSVSSGGQNTEQGSVGVGLPGDGKGGNEKGDREGEEGEEKEDKVGRAAYNWSSRNQVLSSLSSMYLFQSPTRSCGGSTDSTGSRSSRGSEDSGVWREKAVPSSSLSYLSHHAIQVSKLLLRYIR
tara:strand:- start:145 stop:579 length:435 start_codon:yes stop_codon:yes gene_type:complete